MECFKPSPFNKVEEKLEILFENLLEQNGLDRKKSDSMARQLVQQYYPNSGMFQQLVL